MKLTRLFVAAVFAPIIFAAEQNSGAVYLPDGIFIEAETLEGRVGDTGFATVIDEPLGSGGQVLIGLFQKGWADFGVEIPEPGKWTLWARCAVPGQKATLALDLDGINTGTTTGTTLARTNEKTDAPNAYQWRKLTEADLGAGPWRFAVGTGAIRIDCFFLTPDATFQPTDQILEQIANAAAAPRGQALSELTHERRITAHPKWLSHALRPCYAHFEWDKDMDAETWCRRAKESGANCIFGCGEMPAGELEGKLKPFSHANLNRDPSFQFPEGYDLSYGWAKEMTDAAHRHGLKIAIYGGAHRTLDPVIVEHPDWRQQDAAGRPYGSGFGSWHSPYRQAYIDRWVRVAKLARFDGIMIDMLFTGPKGGDYSPWTVEAFQKRFGVEPPREPDPRNLTWQRWIDFQSWTREEMLLDLTEALHAVDPEIAVIPNQTRGWIYGRTDSNFLTTRAADCCDGLLEEMGWEYRHHWDRPWAWPLESAWQNLFLHCRTRPGYGQMWHVSTLNYPEAHARAHSFSMLANGAAPAMVTGGNWPIMSRIWDHTGGCEPWVENAALVPHVAVHFSEDTLDWHAVPAGEETYLAHMKNVFGIFQAILESHIPVQIITDDDLGDSSVLARHAALVLPNSVCLSDRQAEAITSFVNAGGGLVATFETGACDESGFRRKTPALAGLLGAAQTGSTAEDSWSVPLGTPGHPILDDPGIQTSGAWRQGVSDPSPTAYLYAGPRARRVGAAPVTLVDPAAFALPLKGGGAAPKGASFQALIAHSSGKGRTVLFPIDLGHACCVFNHPVNRRLIANAIGWCASRKSPLHTDAPMTVQTILWEKEGAKIVHLVNDISSFGRAAAPNPEAFTAFRDEIIPVHDIRVAVEGSFASAKLYPGGETLPVKATAEVSETTVPRLEAHAMVVFERPRPACPAARGGTKRR